MMSSCLDCNKFVECWSEKDVNFTSINLLLEFAECEDFEGKEADG